MMINSQNDSHKQLKLNKIDMLNYLLFAKYINEVDKIYIHVFEEHRWYKWTRRKKTKVK